MTPDETMRLAVSGAVAGLCPITEANLGDGIFPAADYLGAGGAFGLGTDSNVLIDAAGELRALEYAQRSVHRARNVLAPEAGQSTGRRLFDGALRGGAQALGLSISGLRRAQVPISSASTRPTRSSRGAAGTPCSTAGYLQAAQSIASGDGEQEGRRGGRHRHRELVRERYLRVMTGLLG